MNIQTDLEDFTGWTDEELKALASMPHDERLKARLDGKDPVEAEDRPDSEEAA